jgi:hypothetical protein
MSLGKKLEQVLENAEYASSEVCSARNSLPDYSANESSNTMMSQAESYLDDAIGDLQDLLEELKAEERGIY